MSGTGGGEEVSDGILVLTSRTESRGGHSALSQSFQEVPFGLQRAWPKMIRRSVPFNGCRTFRDCWEGAGKLRYTSYENI